MPAVWIFRVDEAVKEVIGIAVFPVLFLPRLWQIKRKQASHAVIHPPGLIAFPVPHQCAFVSGIVPVLGSAAGVLLRHHAPGFVVLKRTGFPVCEPDHGRFPACLPVLVLCPVALGIGSLRQPAHPVIDRPVLPYLQTIRPSLCRAVMVTVIFKSRLSARAVRPEDLVARRIIPVHCPESVRLHFLGQPARFVIHPCGFSAQTVLHTDPMPVRVILIPNPCPILIGHRKDLSPAVILVMDSLIPNTACYDYLTSFWMVFCFIGIPVCQSLQHNSSSIVILISQVSNLCLIYSLFQISMAVILIMGDAQIHMNYIRQITIFIVVLHGSSYAVL